MIGHKLSNKTKNATVAKPKLFHQLNNSLILLSEPAETPQAASARRFKGAESTACADSSTLVSLKAVPSTRKPVRGGMLIYY
jgi:hypothetical protein